jgi:hypothetical protein
MLAASYMSVDFPLQLLPWFCSSNISKQVFEVSVDELENIRFPAVIWSDENIYFCKWKYPLNFANTSETADCQAIYKQRVLHESES